MFCPFCGSQVPEDTTFCPECGQNLAKEKIDKGAEAAVQKPAATASEQGHIPPAPSFVQPTPLQQPTPPQTQGAPQPGFMSPTAGTSRQEKIRIAEQNGQGMKWYKFLVYFSLIAGGVSGILCSMLFLTGGIWSMMLGGSVDVEQIYAINSGLRVISVVSGIILLAMAALNIVCWIFMRQFNKKGILLFYATYIASAVFEVITLFSPQANKISAIVGILISLGALYLNMVYFKKRAYLFTEE